ncbi:hypothetical protein HanRHA438_Chr04g0190501 [Helianthus annuus]|uniref:Uncharacterized protein n=1 Tax=Helianthus annuus TaxID=4232 RepID=A0A251V0Q0_HELAN|nr:hypothetical protein HanXRQr2_Chr04g0180861 [Helianthus annuus]KAJ0582041.1 hypothetical protein HanHA300_Chr04g0147871 [Helianthus annuus]KAJ0590178.1 hypothetical protein HanIR_Chr04g0194541 [Helianthus annuus]KAJ0598024.1 hypothetical protein HanHA89_Chr04g0161231 [Helianthus annuus]KAJ0758654.1 hypothetical protein HanLR1_Chr04g0152811 [Helianthus annuus]
MFCCNNLSFIWGLFGCTANVIVILYVIDLEVFGCTAKGILLLVKGSICIFWLKGFRPGQVFCSLPSTLLPAHLGFRLNVDFWLKILGRCVVDILRGFQMVLIDETLGVQLQMYHLSLKFIIIFGKKIY